MNSMSAVGTDADAACRKDDLAGGSSAWRHCWVFDSSGVLMHFGREPAERFQPPVGAFGECIMRQLSAPGRQAVKLSAGVCVATVHCLTDIPTRRRRQATSCGVEAGTAYAADNHLVRLAANPSTSNPWSTRFRAGFITCSTGPSLPWNAVPVQDMAPCKLVLNHRTRLNRRWIDEAHQSIERVRMVRSFVV